MSLSQLRFAVSDALVLTLALAWCSLPVSTTALGDTLPRSAGQQPAVVRVAQTAEAAVVNILTTRQEEWRPPMHPLSMPEPFDDDSLEKLSPPPFEKQPVQDSTFSMGSGFLISADGYIVTNHHVVEDAETITVRLASQEEFAATLIGADDQVDLALLKITASHPLPFVPLGSSDALAVGNWVVAIGNPYGLPQSVSIGIVSAKGRMIGDGPYDDYIQTDAAINPGSSGGPLLDLEGVVVGINTAIFSRWGGSVGIGFAIPIDQAKGIIRQLKESGRVTRAWLGVRFQPLTLALATAFGLPEPHGVLIADVTPGGPADTAGLAHGDILTELNGTPIDTARGLPRVIAQAPIGRPAFITVLRDGQKQVLTVTLEERPNQQAQVEKWQAGEERWGVTVANLTTEAVSRFHLYHGETGVVVVTVAPNSPAEQAGIRPGNVIEEVNRVAVESVEEFTEALATAQDEEDLLLLVRHGPVSSFYALHRQE